MNFIVALVLVIIASIIDWQKAKESWAWAWKTFWLKYIVIFVAILIVSAIPAFLTSIAVAWVVYTFSDTVITLALGLYNSVKKLFTK